MEDIEIYESMSKPPKSALRAITGGRLSGKTDINPQWRYKVMTETFGLIGRGWKFTIDRLWTEQGAGGEVLAFAQVSVLTKQGDEWSEPIQGVGGSKMVALERERLQSSDEGYKMAITDALSVALKMLGVASSIYEGLWNGKEYQDEVTDPKAVLMTVGRILKTTIETGETVFTKEERDNIWRFAGKDPCGALAAVKKAYTDKTGVEYKEALNGAAK
jgi:hypothetical protein